MKMRLEYEWRTGNLYDEKTGEKIGKIFNEELGKKIIEIVNKYDTECEGDG